MNPDPKNTDAEAVAALDALVSAAYNLSNVFVGSNSEELLCHGYPKIPSFDEFCDDLCAWRDAVRAHYSAHLDKILPHEAFDHTRGDAYYLAAERLMRRLREKEPSVIRCGAELDVFTTLLARAHAIRIMMSGAQRPHGWQSYSVNVNQAWATDCVTVEESDAWGMMHAWFGEADDVSAACVHRDLTTKARALIEDLRKKYPVSKCV